MQQKQNNGKYPTVVLLPAKSYFSLFLKGTVVEVFREIVLKIIDLRWSEDWERIEKSYVLSHCYVTLYPYTS